MGVVEIGSGIVEAYTSFIATLPVFLQDFINLFLLTIVIVIYAVFIWKLYRFISQKNLFHFNLSQYNKAEHPVMIKIFATILYLVEYILLVPFLIFAWFVIFTLFLVFLTDSLDFDKILLIAVTIIAAIRMTAYIPKYGQDLSREIAKLVPFTLLAVSLLTPGFFNFARVIGHLGQIPALLSVILNYLLFIIILEIVLRLFDFLFSITGLQTAEEENPPEDQPIQEVVKKAV
jgi:hypothetical protein